MKIIIVGGVAGGATAAARIRRNDETAEIILVERGQFISFANCGLPYHISGMIEEREQLLVTSEDAFKARYRVDVRSRTEAIAIDRKTKVVRLRALPSGDEYDESYDKLLLSPGAEAIRPKLPGIDSPRVFGLRNIPDLDRIMNYLKDHRPRRAVVIGGGFIGIEVTENLHERGIFTTLVEGTDQILAPLDYEMAAIVHSHMRDKNIELYLQDKVDQFEDKDDHTVVYLSSGRRLQADLVILAIGVRPETTLARAAGIELGKTGGIKVNAYLQSSDPDIYAVGDAIEVTQTISGRQVLIPLAGPANRQGRMAADNIICGNTKAYRGTQGTSILKAFDLAAATTGLNEKQLNAAGIPFLSCITHSGSHASYYPGAKQISLKLLFTDEGKILGAQAVGADGADKRIDVIATAIHGGLKVEDLAELELAYAPPFGSAKDPINIAGYVGLNVLNQSHDLTDWRTLHSRLEAGDSDIQLIDVRTADEFGLGSIPTARNIDVNQLRERFDELDRNKPVVIFCQIGLRGYLAYRMLIQHGFTRVQNLSGGYKTYTWAVEKQANPDIFDYEDIKRRSPEEIEAERTGSCAVSAAMLAPGTSGELHTLNAVGLQCPGPIMKTYKAMEAMDAGELLEVTASDPAFGRDIRAWAKKTGNDVLSVKAEKGLVVVLLRKVAQAPLVASSPAMPVRDKLTLVVFSDDLDKVMASMIIANGAMAMGKPVSIFFTFWGLDVIRRTDAPHLNKPMMDKMFSTMLPSDADHLNTISKMDMHGLGAKMIRKVMHDKGVETPGNLLHSLVDGGAQLIACQMSMDVMGIQKEELIDGVEIGGVAAFLGEAGESGTTLFI
ncbi:MAG: pyridine nucleotide-disulfide oxidoreductase [Zetaproteobacteria bacterium CG_4_9_14_3_um_filter_49_83]|nr:MAG: pyridine nucleotide-disulfide oxidoreductase [Zetaproteobacteria bacterium CG1_02_49_23]PIQ33176.1 MAG: pyridine nucleotide-disulfide oxidoreductase [Zetaproteobacteria bacterium CG17_big_fil_post_rev_8_21_14_2_50_50_13]PIV29378.1 MAG: pyridine nucleotide-disulfide oxidoreductase [Zetaproteobacteria bacterium CG02_land_8_20_14_3_00_50_9]PIY54812.1 MAG: pyridine nucleotide-disulfide oxidoreductase [Zetaproteobacteria bacterium CG_4_10_14_0_8_um_filter_49_80]PJA33659.1 MAG: pyridine nucle